MEIKERNRLRGDNWTQDEKDLLFEILQKSAPIVENKFTDTNTNKKKQLEWLKVQNKLKELTGKPRDIAQIKGFWNRSKVAAKKRVTRHRKAIQAPGGGQQPPSPSPEDLKILALCPTDFHVDVNIFDSDSVPQAGPDEPPVNPLYDMDEDSENTEGSLVGEISEANSEEIEKAPVRDPRRLKVLKDPKVEKNYKKQTRKGINTSKAVLLESNKEIKKRAKEMMEKEHSIKMEYHKKELAHQQLRHKLELDLLLLDKEKKQLVIDLLKKKLSKE